MEFTKSLSRVWRIVLVSLFFAVPAKAFDFNGFWQKPCDDLTGVGMTSTLQIEKDTWTFTWTTYQEADCRTAVKTESEVRRAYLWGMELNFEIVTSDREVPMQRIFSIQKTSFHRNFGDFLFLGEPSQGRDGSSVVQRHRVFEIYAYERPRGLLAGE